MRKFMVLCALMLSLFVATGAMADSAAEIDRNANKALRKLNRSDHASVGVLDKAAGVLVFPGLVKAGIGVGGEYGEGVLMERGRPVAYYNLVAGSIGLQLGAQKRAQIIAFMTKEGLDKFKNSEGWKAGVDGSVVIAKSGKSGAYDTETLNSPIIGWILGEKGLMYNANLEGIKITKLDK